MPALSTVVPPRLRDGAEPLPPLLQKPALLAVLTIAWPVLGEQLVASLVALTDTFVAGRISPDASAAVGAIGFFGWLANCLFALVSVGATALVSRAVGAGDLPLARLATGQAIRLAAVIGGVLAVLFIAAIPAMNVIIHVTPASFAIVRPLVVVTAISFVPASVLFACSACLKGAGDTRSTLRAMLLVNFVNIVSTWTLTFGIAGWGGLGVIGIEVGTVVAWTVGTVLMVQRLYRSHTGIAPQGRGGWHWPTCQRLLRVGVPAGLDSVLMWTAQAVFMAMVTRIPGTDPTITYAAHMIAVRVESLAYLPAMAFGIAASALVGQGLGAERPDLARRLGLAAAGVGSVFAAIIGAVFFLFAEPLIALFTSDPRVLEAGVLPLQIVSFAQLGLAWLWAFQGGLRGAGYTRVPVLITLFSMFAIRLPLTAVMIFILHTGLPGAWMAMSVDLILRGTLLAQRFWSNAWMESRV